MKSEQSAADRADTYILHTDGAARGNPGPAGAGALLLDPAGNEAAQVVKYLGETTNNVAEYQALLLGLEAALDHGVVNLLVRMDSELIVKQLSGAYKVKAPHLRPMFDQARALLAKFKSARVTHVRRAQNKDADLLANQAIDAYS